MDNAVISGQIGRRIVSFIDLGTNSLRTFLDRRVSRAISRTASLVLKRLGLCNSSIL